MKNILTQLKNDLQSREGWVTAIVLAMTLAGIFNIFHTLYYSAVAARTEPEIPLPRGSMPAAARLAAQDFPQMGAPARFAIPKLAVDTEVLEVGLNDKGNMGVPKSYDKVGWYKHGPNPGSVGNAVLAGHFDNALGRPGVFYELSRLVEGDEIIVTDTEGRTAVFAVTGTRHLDYNATSTDDIFGAAGEARLNLITCDGTWIQDKKTYDKRLVVYSRRIR